MFDNVEHSDKVMKAVYDTGKLNWIAENQISRYEQLRDFVICLKSNTHPCNSIGNHNSKQKLLLKFYKIFVRSKSFWDALSEVRQFPIQLSIDNWVDILPILSQNHITGDCSGKRTQNKKILIFREEKKRKEKKRDFWDCLQKQRKKKRNFSLKIQKRSSSEQFKSSSVCNV